MWLNWPAPSWRKEKANLARHLLELKIFDVSTTEWNRFVYFSLKEDVKGLHRGAYSKGILGRLDSQSHSSPPLNNVKWFFWILTNCKCFVWSSVYDFLLWFLFEKSKDSIFICSLISVYTEKFCTTKAAGRRANVLSKTSSVEALTNVETQYWTSRQGILAFITQLSHHLLLLLMWKSDIIIMWYDTYCRCHVKCI